MLLQALLLEYSLFSFIVFLASAGPIPNRRLQVAVSNFAFIIVSLRLLAFGVLGFWCFSLDADPRYCPSLSIAVRKVGGSALASGLCALVEVMCAPPHTWSLSAKQWNRLMHSLNGNVIGPVIKRVFIFVVVLVVILIPFFIMENVWRLSTNKAIRENQLKHGRFRTLRRFLISWVEYSPYGMVAGVALFLLSPFVYILAVIVGVLTLIHGHVRHYFRMVRFWKRVEASGGVATANRLGEGLSVPINTATTDAKGWFYSAPWKRTEGTRTYAVIPPTFDAPPGSPATYEFEYEPDGTLLSSRNIRTGKVYRKGEPAADVPEVSAWHYDGAEDEGESPGYLSDDSTRTIVRGQVRRPVGVVFSVKGELGEPPKPTPSD